MIDGKKIAIIIPAYNVGDIAIKLIKKIPDFIDKIFLIDDCCPKKTGEIIKNEFKNLEKIEIIFNERNIGVGGSVKKGYAKSLEQNYDYSVKIDADNQMDPSEIVDLINPIIKDKKLAYTKGNRFLRNHKIKNYPIVRFYGNIGLSFLSKLSTGYWDLYDPVNGFTAISNEYLKKINFDNIDNRYFFETDMLHNLYSINAKVYDIPVTIRYFPEQKQNLNVKKEFFIFLFKNIKRIFARIKYSYLSNNFSIGSFFIFFSIIFFLTSFFVGGFNWIKYVIYLNEFAPTGIVVLSFLSLFVSILFFGIFLYFDSLNNPNNKK